MRWLFRIGLGVVGVLAAIVGAAAVWLATLDLNQYKSEIAEQVSAATGRAFSIGGQAEIRLSLTPSVRVTEVRLANAPWGSPTDMLRVREMAARFDVLPIFAGELKVKDLALTGASLILERNAEGVGNWVFDENTEAQPSTPSQPPTYVPLLERVRLQDIDIEFRDHSGERAWKGRVKQFDSVVDTASGSMDAKASGNALGQPFTLEIDLNSALGLIRGTGASSVTARIAALNANVTIKGSVDPTAARPFRDVALTLEGPEAAETSAAFGALVPSIEVPPFPRLGRFRLATTARLDLPRISLLDLEASVGSEDTLGLKAKGSVGDIVAGTGLNLNVVVSGPEAATAIQLASGHAPQLKPYASSPLGPFRASAKVDGTAEDVRVANLDLQIGTLERLRLTARGSIAHIPSATDLDLDLMVSGPEAATAIQLASSHAPQLKPYASAPLGPFRASAKVDGTAEDVRLANLDLQIGTLETVRLTARGGVAHIPSATGLDLRVELMADELSRLLDILRPHFQALPPTNAAPLGPVSATARITGSLDALALGGLGLAAGDKNQVHVSAKGSIGDLRGLQQYRLPVAIEWKDPGPMLKATIPGASQVPQFRLAGVLSDSKGQVRLDELVAMVKGSTIKGRIALGLDKPRPHLEASLETNSARLKDFELVSPTQPAPRRKSEESRQHTRFVIPDTPLPFGELNTANADVSLRVGRLNIAPGWDLMELKAKLRLRDGKADLRLLNAKSRKGRVSGSLRVDASIPRPALDLQFEANNVLLDDVLRYAGQPGLVKGSKVNASATLKSNGLTLRQIAAALNGRAAADVGPGQVRNQGLKILSGDIVSQFTSLLITPTKSDSHSKLECGVMRVWATDGFLRSSRGIALETETVGLIAGGILDLRDERIDVAFRSDAKKGLKLSVGQSLARLVRLRGTLGHPEVGVDQAGVAESAARLGIAVATSGISLLAERVAREVAHTETSCQIARATTLEAANDSKNLIPKSIEAVTEGAKKGIESGAKGISSTAKGAGKSIVESVGKVGDTVGKGAGKIRDTIGRGLRSLFGKEKE